MGDVTDRYNLTVCSIADLPESATHIVFADDFIGSGRQAVDILEAWLSEPRSEDLGEDRVELPPPVANTLRAGTLGFVFTAGFDIGRDHLRQRLESLRINGDVFTYLPETSLPFAFGSGIFGEASDAFREACARIGQELLEAVGQPPVLAAERALGYGNRGLLLVFPLNTPAQTLTVLWQSGPGDKVPWRALFPRRRKGSRNER